MSPEAQRIAIAEACGWKITDDEDWKKRLIVRPNGMASRPSDPRIPVASLLPDYLGSLDAIAQAEESCLNTPEQWRQYVLNIAKTIAGDHRPRAAGNKLKVDTSVMISAASHIRAEALLRTLNLWA